MINSGSVTDKKQNFFKPVVAPGERQDLIHSLVQAESLLQVKLEGVKTQGAQDLTILKVIRGLQDGVGCSFISGPVLNRGEVTVAFELEKALFFCTGRITESGLGLFVILFNKVYELQRRDAYRVIIAQDLISAKLISVKVNNVPLDQEYRIADLSTGGMGVAVNPEDAQAFPASGVIQGQIKIGLHERVEVRALIKYRRKVTSEQRPYFHIGCEFQQMTAALNQKIGFLVNDCHRISFSRISK